MISFIVPAHNEEAWIERCLLAIRAAMQDVGEPYETVVVDDSSTDSTAMLAQAVGSHVVRVSNRQISATRNAGAHEARGDIFIFVDADTLINAKIMTAALSALDDGAVGGGCVPVFEGRLPPWWKALSPIVIIAIRLFRLPGGACLFCTRSAFEAAGGFSEAHYAAEEAVFVGALKRHGRFVVLNTPVVASGRNLRAHSFWTIARLIIRLAIRGPDAFRERQGLDLWYRPLREKS